MKFKLKLSDNYTLKRPFICEWNKELIGDALRAEFDTYLEDHKKSIGFREGTTKVLLVMPILQRFMNSKRISLVENPLDGSLVSRFVLQIGEEKLIDERAAKALRCFKKTQKRLSDGTLGDIEGFMDITNIERESKPTNEDNIRIVGADISYFDGSVEEAIKESIPAVEKVLDEKITKLEEGEEGFKCEGCGKSFKNKGILAIHKKKCLQLV